MASLRTYARNDGTTSHAVLFRNGRKQASRTFDDEASASRFRVLVEELGAARALKYLEEDLDDRVGATLDDLAARWLESKAGTVTPNILTGYRRDYDTWIAPRLGHREAATVTEVDVQAWIDWLRVQPSATGRPLSAKSIADRHAILHQVYAWASAKTRDLVPHNPCRETDLPKRVKTPPKGLRLPELHALLEAAETVDHDAADLVAFMAGTGWRIGEAVALLAGAVEDDGDHVFVDMQRVLRRGVGYTAGGKSDAAMRRLRVLGPAVAVLRRRLVGLGPGDFVFTFADGRPGVKRRRPWNVSSFRDVRWPRLVEAAGLTDRHPTPHWLRHTHVALCIAAGLSLAEVQRRLGHEDVQTTINIYGRMIEDMSDEAASRLEVLLTPSRTPVLVEGTVVGSSVVVRGEVP